MKDSILVWLVGGYLGGMVSCVSGLSSFDWKFWVAVIPMVVLVEIRVRNAKRQ